MRFPLLAALQKARPHLSPALIATPALAALESTAASLPDVATSFGFECRLDASPRVDLGLLVEPGNGGRTALASGNLAGDDLGREAWRRVFTFAAAWNECSSPVQAWVPFVFLELDAGESAPSLFAALDWPLDDGALPEVRRAAQAVLHLLLQRDGGETRTSAAVDRCFEALPRFARVLHAGAMLGRPGRAARLSVALPGATMREYLARLEHGADIAPLEEVLALAETHISHSHPWHPRQVDFEIGAGASAGLGIGLRPANAEEWGAMLDALVALGLCEREKSDALLAWPGTSREHLGAPCRFVRYLSHVKIALSSSGALTAKAYFGVTPRFDG